MMDCDGFDDRDEGMLEVEMEPERYEDDLEQHELRQLDLDRECDEDDMRNEMFADPGGRSALRAASASNPRNLPCPTCERPNMLTPKDRALGYQCDICADNDEMGSY